MLGCFGDIVFGVSDKKILTFEEFTRETASTYENHALIGQKPRTEFVAPGLDTITFTVILRADHGIKPKEEMDKWLEYCRTGDAFPLLIGENMLGVDKWVVTAVSQQWDTVFNQGELVTGKADVTLQEYVESMWTVDGYKNWVEKEAEQRREKYKEFAGLTLEEKAEKIKAEVEQNLVKGGGEPYNGYGATESSYDPETGEIKNSYQFITLGAGISSTPLLNDGGGSVPDYTGANSVDTDIKKQIEEIRQIKAEKLSEFYRTLYNTGEATLYGSDAWNRPLSGNDIIDYVQKNGIKVNPKKDYTKSIGFSIMLATYGINTQTHYDNYCYLTKSPMSKNEFVNTCGLYWEVDWRDYAFRIIISALEITTAIFAMSAAAYCYILDNVSVTKLSDKIFKFNWGGITSTGVIKVYVPPSISLNASISISGGISAAPAAYIEQVTRALVERGISGTPPSGKYSEAEIKKILDELQGDGFKNNPLRQKYEGEVADLSKKGDELLKQGIPKADVAKTLHQARRDLGIKYKDMTPQPLRDYIYEININRYNDPLGPTFEYLLESGKTYDQIIESSSRYNPNIDKLLSGFEQWLRRQ